jgi:hypothetical protein
LARSLTDPPLESAPVGVGVGVGVGDADALGEGNGHGPSQPMFGVFVGGAPHPSTQLLAFCADAGVGSITSAGKIAPVSAANTTRLRMNFAIVSARTICRWDLQPVWHRQIA